MKPEPGSRRGDKVRLDQLLVERGLVDSRSRAQALIMAGLVHGPHGEKFDKPGRQVPHDGPVELVGQDHPWVSRGGVKLAHGLDRFGIDPNGLIALDVGSSTGGFTDVLLARGAARVFAVDVGHGQLAWKLRTDARVIVLERTNARTLSRIQMPEPVDLIVCDASFIGLKTVLPASLALARPGAWLVALIKPQFEVGPTRVGKGGVVRDPTLHTEVCQDIASWLADAMGWTVLSLCESPLFGAEGNKEFLIGAHKADG